MTHPNNPDLLNTVLQLLTTQGTSSLAEGLRLLLNEATPDHSSLSVIRKRLPREVYEEVFAFSLRDLRKSGLLVGERLGLDSTTMEADASMEKLVRRDDGMSYADYVAGLAAAEGIDPEDKGAVAAFDRKRPGRKTSNEEWVNPHDPDASFGPRKDGAWDMLHKVENVVDLDSGAIVSTEIQPATKGDADGMAAHLETGFLMVEYTAAGVDEQDDDRDGGNEEQGGGGEADAPKRHGVGDKGYHKNSELVALVAAGIAPVIAEPAGKGPSRSDEAAAEAFAMNLANRRSEEGRAMMKARAEKVERSFQHLLDHGGGRRTTLRGHLNIGKRLLAMAFVFNVARYRRSACGYGTLKQALAGNRWKKPFFTFLRAMGGALRRTTSPWLTPTPRLLPVFDFTKTSRLCPADTQARCVIDYFSSLLKHVPGPGERKKDSSAQRESRTASPGRRVPDGESRTASPGPQVPEGRKKVAGGDRTS